uniref:Calponin-homology (CH) domain-containing protein n=1 Tax=Strigamia maritima TaxID=126957 RepID=T1IN84_STRMM
MMASAALALLGGHAGSHLTRSLERVVEEAQLTGEIRLSGRKLKEFPKIASKYNLNDTVLADLSKNKFTELPIEVCDYVSLERLDCYHNIIRTIPEAVICLHSLTHLNLSRNQLTTLPVTLCQLPLLEVLIVSNNKLVSLPEEISGLDQLMELDASCNEISHLPPQIEDLENLKSLNLRRNHLVELPIEVTNLPLVKLDISMNRITTLPTQFRRLIELSELELDNNPLISPPAYLCTRGRVHIFKYLEIQAIKENKKRGVIDTEVRRTSRKKFNKSLNGIPLNSRSKRYTIDSGYNTSDGSGDKRWSQEFQDVSYFISRALCFESVYHTFFLSVHALQLTSEMDEARKLALRAAELTKEQRQERERSLHVRLSQLGFHHGYSSSGSNASLALYADNDALSCSSTPSTLSPNKIGDSTYEDAFNRELNRQKLQDERKRSDRHENDENNECQRRIRTNSLDRQTDQNMMNNRHSTSSDSTISALSFNDSLDGSYVSSLALLEIEKRNYKEWLLMLLLVCECVVFSFPPDPSFRKTIPHNQTYREYKEALRQQRCAENSSGYQRVMASWPETVSLSQLSLDAKSQPTGALVTNHNTPEDEFRSRHDSIMQQHQYHAQVAQRRMDERRKQKEAVLSYVKSRTSPHRLSDNESSEINVNHSPSSTNYNSSYFKNGTTIPFPHFTMRREFDKAKEEAVLVKQLRIAIETRLKVALPEDTAAALMDGVVLCHLANHVRPRSVASIHVPSPGVPKLTMAKCRRNVENFIDACRRIGIAEVGCRHLFPPFEFSMNSYSSLKIYNLEYVCSTQDILEEKAPVRTAITVQALLNILSTITANLAYTVSTRRQRKTTGWKNSEEDTMLRIFSRQGGTNKHFIMKCKV